MKRFRLIGLALVAVFALGAVLSASAFALPEFSSTSKSFTGKLDSGKAILENSAGTLVTCTAAAGSGGEVSKSSGTFKINFEGCETNLLGTHKCTGTSDATEGVILSEGSFNYVFDTLGGTLGVAILFLPKVTTFNCTTLAKNEVKGDVLCLILETLVSSLTHLFHCAKGTAAGSQIETKYWLDNGSPTTAQLLSSLNGGEFKESNEQALAANTTATVGVWINE